MSATSRYYRPPTETRRIPTYEELFGTPKSAERIAYDKQKEQEARISAEEARKRRIEEDKKEREAYLAEQERIKSERLIAEGKEIVGTYRDSYDANAFLYETAENPYQRQQRLGLSDLEFGLEIANAAVQNPSNLGISNKDYLNRYDINQDGKVTSRDSKRVMEGNLADLFPLETVENPYERQQRLGLSDLELGLEIADAAVMRSSGLGLTEEEYLNRYDINLDGKVTSKDAKRVMEGDFADLFPAPETQATFEDAKLAADETYMQYWYDKANDIVGNWTDEDYKLIAEPQYEDVQVAVDSKRGVYRTEQRQVLPEGYEELQEINSYIEKGPLDFSSEETHKMLIKGPTKRGYTKHQEWIDESDPLRQAVEAQADVMKDYLDNKNISITKDFEDGNPDNVYGEGIYLNTGTAAHINWDSELKRMQRYMTTPDSELGTYSQVFYRPEKESILDNVMVDVIAAVTGTTPYLTAARGGDFEDIAKSIVAKQVAPDILENTLASVGVDADLFGIDPDTFSEGITEVQTAVIEGGSIQDAVGSAFGGELLDAAGEVFEDIAPVIDVPEIVEDLGNAVVSVVEPVLNTIEEISEPVVQTTQAVIEPIITPIVETVEEITPEIQETFEQLVEEVAPIVEKVIVEPVEQVAPVVEELAKVITPIVEDVVVEPVEKIVETLTPVVEEVVVEPVEQLAPVVEEAIVKPVETIAPIVEEVIVEPIETIAPVVEEAIEPVTSVVENVADNLGIDNELVGVTEERFSEVMSEAEEAMLAGESGKDVIIKELGGDIIGELGEGAENLLGNVIDVAETVLSPVEPFVEPFADLAGAVLSPVGDILETGVDVAGEVLSPIGDVIETGISAGSDVLSNVEDVVSDIASEGEDIIKSITDPAGELGQQAIDAISDVTSEVEDVVSDVASEAEDVVKAVTDPIGEVGQDVIDTISDVTSDAEDVISDVTSEVEDVILDVYEQVTDIDLPEVDIDLPEVDIDLPEVDIDVPSIDIPTPSFDPRLLAGLMAMPQQQQQATQVEGLFDKELFKFDTEIKSTQEMLSPMMNLRRYG